MLRSAIIVTIVAAVCTTHVAAAPPRARLGLSNDPNEIVCVSETKIGSRLDRRRVCRTRAEWAEHREQTRNSVQRAQNQSQTQCVPTPTMQC